MTSSIEEEKDYPRFQSNIAYGDQHALQNLDICLPRPLHDSDANEQVWIIFIHGGAWMDVKQDKAELNPALSQLLGTSAPTRSSTERPPALKHIAGFASLNYGLSTHAGDADKHGIDPSLCVRHPAHVSDILLGLQWLRKEFGVGETSSTSDEECKDDAAITTTKNKRRSFKYILVGHSAGATLAFQTLTQKEGTASLQPPLAIIGLAGIYSLPLLLQNHTDEPFYAKFVHDAFGSDENGLESASPVSGGPEYEEAQSRGGLKVLVLGASVDDVLVEMEQRETMSSVLEKGGLGNGESGRDLVMLDLKGSHDEIWKLGTGVRESIELAVQRLFT